MHRTLWGTGAGLMAFSSITALFLSAVELQWAAEHVTFMALAAWGLLASLVLGAALVAAGLIIAQLAPPEVPPHDARTAAPADWFA